MLLAILQFFGFGVWAVGDEVFPSPQFRKEMLSQELDPHKGLLKTLEANEWDPGGFSEVLPSCVQEGSGLRDHVIAKSWPGEFCWVNKL